MCFHTLVLAAELRAFLSHFAGYSASHGGSPNSKGYSDDAHGADVPGSAAASSPAVSLSPSTILIPLSLSRAPARSCVVQARGLLILGVAAAACTDSSRHEAGGSTSLLVGKESTWCKWDSESSCQSRARNTTSAFGACSLKVAKALSPRCLTYLWRSFCFSTDVVLRALHGLSPVVLSGVSCFLEFHGYIGNG